MEQRKSRDQGYRPRGGGKYPGPASRFTVGLPNPSLSGEFAVLLAGTSLISFQVGATTGIVSSVDTSDPDSSSIALDTYAACVARVDTLPPTDGSIAD